MWYLPGHAIQFIFVTQTPIWAGILVGVMVEVCGVLLWVQPQLRFLLGALVVMLSLASFITSDFGGLFIGMLLGILGGSLGLSWSGVAGKTKRQQRWLAKTTGEAAEPVGEASSAQ